MMAKTMPSNSVILDMFFDAIERNDIHKVDEMLKSRQVNVNDRNITAQNGTALHLAACNGHGQLVKLLVEEHRADINAKNDWEKNPLQTATDNYHRKICKYLIGQNSDNADFAKDILNSAEVDDLFDAAEENDIARVIELIESNAVHVDSEDKGGYHATILHVAARKGYEDLARVLVDKFKANINHVDDIGDRTIHIAAQRGHVGIVKFLAERGSEDSEDVLKFVESADVSPPICD